MSTEIQKNTAGAHIQQSIQALHSRRAIEASQPELDNILLTAVLKAQKDLGYSADQAKVDHIVNNLAAEVIAQVPHIRIQEIPLAINRGVFGEYGEYIGLSVASIIRFLKAYYESEQRAEAVKTAERARLEAEKTKQAQLTPSPEEIIHQERLVIIVAFTKYKNTGHYQDYGNHIYSLLDRRGLITFTAERKKEFMARGKDAIRKRNDPKTAISMDEKKRFAATLQLIDDHAKGENLIIQEAKQIALSEYFQQVMEIGTDITDILDNSLNSQ